MSEETITQGIAEATVAGDPAAEAAALKDQLLRTLAEMENLRKRTAREAEDARRYAVTGFARSLLEVADNLARALAAVPPAERTASRFMTDLVAGIELTERSLAALFERHEIRKVTPARGERFDHNRHQAMFEVTTGELPAGSIAEVMQPGYVIADRLLRPALVGVAKAAPRPAPAHDEAGAPGRQVDEVA
jgi:molecular chaperone GrpE